MEKVENNLDI